MPSFNELPPVNTEWSALLAFRLSPSPPANPREVVRDRSERLALGCLTQHAARMVDMSCGRYVLEALGQPPEYSGVRKVRSPNATADASGSEIELSSTSRPGFHRSASSTVHSVPRGSAAVSIMAGLIGAQRQRVGTTTLRTFNPRASLMAG
jgi:hypothetical protein